MSAFVDTKTCSHIESYENKQLLSDICVRDLIFQNYQKIQDQNLHCEGENCEEREKENLWICMCCGQIYCGEVKQKHSTLHYENTKKTHHHFLNLGNYQIWCYSCFVYVHNERSQHQIKELFENRRKYEKWKKDQDHSCYSPYVVSGSSGAKTFAQAAEQLVNLQTIAVEKYGELSIANQASTCYIHAILQALSHISYFSKYFIALMPYIQSQPLHYQPREYNPTKQTSIYLKHQLTIHTANAIAALQIPSLQNDQYQQSLCINDLYKSLQAINSNYLQDKQQDAHEFQMNLFDYMGSILNMKFNAFFGMPPRQQASIKYESSFTTRDNFTYYPSQIGTQPYYTIIDECFQGRLINQLSYVCPHCSKSLSRTKDEYFNSINIQPAATMQQAINNLTSPQQIDYMCDDCGKLIKATQQEHYFHLPNVLQLNILQKSQQQITINKELDLQQILAPSSPHLRFNEYQNQQTDGYTVSMQNYEKLLPQALGMRVGQLLVGTIMKRINFQANAQNTPAINQMIEVVCMCCQNGQFYDQLESTLKDLRQKTQRPQSSAQKVQCLIKVLYQELSLLRQGKASQAVPLLRQKLIQRLQKAVKIPFDRDAFACGLATYQLQAVVFHTGDERSGHYTTVCALEKGQYKQFTDSKIVCHEDVTRGPGPAPYTAYYQKVASPLQLIVNQLVFSELRAAGRGRPQFENVFDFLRAANECCRRLFALPVLRPGQELEARQPVSGEFVYRLLQLPWPGPPAAGALDDGPGRYAVQPAMVPPCVEVPGRLRHILEALYGAPPQVPCGTQQGSGAGRQGDRAAQERLYDTMFGGAPRGRAYALGRRFIEHWAAHLFSDAGRPGRFHGVVNEELCSEQAPFNRFALRPGLREGRDYVCIAADDHRALGRYYRTFDVQLLDPAGPDALGLGAPGAAPGGPEDAGTAESGAESDNVE